MAFLYFLLAAGFATVCSQSKKNLIRFPSRQFFFNIRIDSVKMYGAPRYFIVYKK